MGAASSPRKGRPIRVARLKQRADFLALRQGARVSRRAFLLQARPNGLDHARVGFTVTKKLGNAVVRNRIKRRLRAAIDQLAEEHTIAGFDYVLLARSPAETLPFDRLLDDLRSALLDRRVAETRS